MTWVHACVIRLTTIRKIVTALIISVFAVGTIVMYLLGDWVPFMSGMSMSGKWGQALLSAAILLALSSRSKRSRLSNTSRSTPSCELCRSTL